MMSEIQQQERTVTFRLSPEDKYSVSQMPSGNLPHAGPISRKLRRMKRQLFLDYVANDGSSMVRSTSSLASSTSSDSLYGSE